MSGDACEGLTVSEGIDFSRFLLSLDEDGDINVMIPDCFDICRLREVSVEIGTGAFLISVQADQLILSILYLDAVVLITVVCLFLVEVLGVQCSACKVFA